MRCIYNSPTSIVCVCNQLLLQLFFFFLKEVLYTEKYMGWKKQKLFLSNKCDAYGWRNKYYGETTGQLEQLESLSVVSNHIIIQFKIFWVGERRAHWDTESNKIIELKKNHWIEHFVYFMLCIITLHISLFKIFSKSNDFPREKKMYCMKTNFFMIAIFVLLILGELRTMYVLSNIDSLIV